MCLPQDESFWNHQNFTFTDENWWKLARLVVWDRFVFWKSCSIPMIWKQDLLYGRQMLPLSEISLCRSRGICSQTSKLWAYGKEKLRFSHVLGGDSARQSSAAGGMEVGRWQRVRAQPERWQQQPEVWDGGDVGWCLQGKAAHSTTTPLRDVCEHCRHGAPELFAVGLCGW